MDASECASDENCEWSEDIDVGSCSALCCDLISDCNWEYVCIEMGWWYNAMSMDMSVQEVIIK